MKNKIILILFIITNICFKSYSQNSDLLITSNGSSRATAYTFSNKIVETPSSLFVLTLDNINSKYSLIIREIRKNDNKIVNEFLLDSSVKDNHGGGALAIDSKGFLHVVYGPHVGPFIYRKSIQAKSVTNFTQPTSFGSELTYPTLSIDKKDNLYLFGRYSPSNQNWGIVMFKKLNGGNWSNGKLLLSADYNPWGGLKRVKANLQYSPYINTSTSTIIDNNGVIHLAFRMYRYLPKSSKNQFVDARNGISYMVGYIKSSDGGNTWYANNNRLGWPVKPNDAERIIGVSDAENSTGLFEISNLTLDDENNPILGISSTENKQSIYYIAKKTAGKWALDKLNLPNVYLFSPSVISYFDKTLTIAACSIDRNKYHRNRLWGHVDNHVEIVNVNINNNSIISKVRSENHSWFPSISNNQQYKPSIMYMQGGATSEKNKVYLSK